MFFLGKVPESAQVLLERLMLLQQKLMASYESGSKSLVCQDEPAVLDLFKEDQLGRIRSGQVTIVSNGVEVAVFEEGDFIGLNRIFGLPYVPLCARGEVEIELIQRDDFINFVQGELVRQHRWSNYLLTSGAMYQQILTHYLVQFTASPHKGFTQLKTGDVIIEQGAEADMVYQLMSGSADVMVNGVKVGEVLQDEIFGAMAVFTGEARNATVIAREDCQLLAIPKNQFVDLIRAQPETALTLLNNMSRRIQALNQQVLEGQALSA